MKQNLLIWMVFTFCLSCNHDREGIGHRGSKNILYKKIELDSVISDVTYTSGSGKFFMHDSVIVFADSYYATFYCFGLDSFQFLDKHFSLGRGADELLSFMFAYPVQGEEDKCIVVDQSLHMVEIDMKNWKLGPKKRINFGRSIKLNPDYELPCNYTLQGMDQFNFKFTRLNDSIYYFPVDIKTKDIFPEGILTEDYFNKRHIFGVLNRDKENEVSHVFGYLPESCQKRKVPHMEFFDYVALGDTLYVNFATDSLIYVYKYPDEFLYTLGYEFRGINRDYTETTWAYNNDIIDRDYSTVGTNLTLTYIKETGLLFRIYVKDMASWQMGMQIYKENDLIGDVDVPVYFRLLGYKTPYYYAVRMMPYQTESEILCVFYKFRLD